MRHSYATHLLEVGVSSSYSLHHPRWWSYLKDGKQWLPAGKNFFLPVKALSIIFRAKFRDELKKTNLFKAVPSDTWKKDWVVHCEPVGSGEHAFKYLAPYIFRVAISNNRILKPEDGMVTFQYKESGYPL